MAHSPDSSNTRFPTCLACGPFDKCKSCALKEQQRAVPISGPELWVNTTKKERTIEFVAVEKRQVADSDNLHIAVAPLKVGEYELGEILGRGQYSVVFRSSASWSQRPLAIRVYEGLPCGGSIVKILTMEAAAVSKLSHPNIVAVYDHGVTSGGAPYVVQDLIEGETLAQRIARFSTDDPLPILIQIAEAVAYAHGKQILHGRLSPDNIFISRNTNGIELAKVSDFSLEYLVLKHGRMRIRGDDPYHSPEQIDGKDIDARSDIFSFGCIMYQVLTGETPFFTREHRQRSPKPFPQVRGNAHLLEPIVRKCLCEDPDERYESMHAVLKDLRAASRSSSTQKLIRTGMVVSNRWGLIVTLLIVLANCAMAYGIWYRH